MTTRIHTLRKICVAHRLTIIFILLLFTGGLHFAGVGYHGYLHPAHDNIPFVLKHFHPDALSADFHTQASTSSNPRNPFSYFLVALAHLFGGDVFSAFAGLQLLVSLLGGTVQFLFYRLLLLRLLRAKVLPASFDFVLTIAVVFMQLGDFAWGFIGMFGNVVYLLYQFFRLASFDALHVIGHAQSWSALLLMIGWISFFSKGKLTLLFYITAFIAGIFHPVQSLIISTFVFCCLIWGDKKRQSLVAFVYSAILPTIVVFLRFKPEAIAEASAAAVYYLDFHKLHYKLSTFSGFDGVLAIFTRISLLGFVGLFLVLKDVKNGYASMLWAAVLACAWMSQYFLAERMQLTQIIYVGPSRFLSMTFWLEVISMLSLVHYLLSKKNRGLTSKV